MMLYNLDRNSTYFSKNVNLLVTLGTVSTATHSSFVNELMAWTFMKMDPLVKPLKFYKCFEPESMMT